MKTKWKPEKFELHHQKDFVQLLILYFPKKEIKTAYFSSFHLKADFGQLLFLYFSEEEIKTSTYVIT